MMVAGAGSGKTTSLVKALAHISRTQGPTLKRRGQKIACITYTEIAAQEIFADVGHDLLFHVSTIHSFLWSQIRPFQTEIHSWVTRRIEEKLTELREQATAFGSRVQQRTKDRNAEDTKRYEAQLTVLPDVKTFVYGTGSVYAEGVLGHDDILKIGHAFILEHQLLRKLIAQKYPFIFVDESQDTAPIVVEALKAVESEMAGHFCLGFFGDPMQKIYATGIGEIPLGPGGKKITKPENFRCPSKVLSVINKIRAGGDGLTQTQARYQDIRGKQVPVEGTARLFILPANEHRGKLLTEVRQRLADENSDPQWLSDGKEADVRILVIVHRMAALRLGFSELYSALNDDAPIAISEGFADGTLWALRPFVSFLLPLVRAVETENHFEVMRLLREFCPLLSREVLSSHSPSAVLNSLKEIVKKLSEILAHDSQAKVGDVLKFVADSKLGSFDERLTEYLGEIGQEPASSSGE